MDNEKKHSDPPRVKIANTLVHGGNQAAMWGVILFSIWADKLDPMPGLIIGGTLTGMGVLQLFRGQPPTSGVVLTCSAIAHACRHLKGTAVLAVVTGSLLVSGCGLFQDPGNTAKDILFSGSKAMLKAACDNLSEDAGEGWQVGCTALQGTLSHLQQTGAGPSELPPEEARQRCVLKAGGELSCEGNQ